jgi:hypothetical protein
MKDFIRTDFKHYLQTKVTSVLLFLTPLPGPALQVNALFATSGVVRQNYRFPKYGNIGGIDNTVAYSTSVKLLFNTIF